MNNPKLNNNNRSIEPILSNLRFLSPLHKASRQIAVQLQRHSAELGISNTEAHLLAYLLSYGPRPVGELLRIFGIKNSTLTSILDRLEDRRLVVREVNLADRRSFLVGLTSKGRQTASQVRSIIEDLEDQIGRRLTQQDMAGFRRVMEAIATVTAVDLRAPAQNGTREDKLTDRQPSSSTANNSQSSTPPRKDRA